MRIVYAGLMVDNPRHGFQLELEKVATGGYKELPTSTPNFQEELIRLVRDFSPNLLFIQTQSPAFTAQGVYELSELTFCMTFNGDIRHSLPAHYIGQERGFQLHTFSNMRDVREARENGLTADWLELGVEESRFRRHGIIKPTPKIVAHMNNYGPGRFELSQFRIDAVTRLKQEFGNDFGVFGHGWGALASGDINGSQVDEAINYNNALLALSISHFFAERYSSDRLVRALASGVCTLVHEYPSIQEMYTPGEHLVSFKTIDELVDRCKHYLNNHQERQRIADAGMNHVLNTYTYKHMARAIIDLFLRYKK